MVTAEEQTIQVNKHPASIWLVNNIRGKSFPMHE